MKSLKSLNAILSLLCLITFGLIVLSAAQSDLHADRQVAQNSTSSEKSHKVRACQPIESHDLIEMMQVGSSDSLSIIELGLSHEDALVRRSAAGQLARQDELSPRVAAALQTALNDDEASVRMEPFMSFSFASSKAKTQLCQDGLASSWSDVRQAAAAQLNSVSDALTKRDLLRCALNDSDPAVRRSGLDGLNLSGQEFYRDEQAALDALR